MDLQEIIRGIRATKSLPNDEDLRLLPFKKAFIYGRVSSQAQVRDSRESIRDIAKLVLTAKEDGYKSSLDPNEIEKWLASIQGGADVNRVIEDGDIIVDCQDLGLSGSLGEEKRPGLAHLSRTVEDGETGTVYLTEGMSRLSRDRDRVLGYKLLKLLKQHKCRVRTVTGVYNPAILRDWDALAADVEDSAEEMKKAGIRMGRRRALKAGEGKHVGSPVCPGYIVAIDGQRSDGSYLFGKWQVYPSHRQVAIEALEEVVKQRSFCQAVKVLRARGVVFPFFPENLKYMETRSALRFYHKDDSGYLITFNDLKSLATNLKLIGIWQWRDVLIENNHEPAVPVDLFIRAYEIAKSAKPKGRAAYAEPLEWAGLLYCHNHDEPRRVMALNTVNRWACRSPQYSGFEPSCLQIADHFLTPPLTQEVLRCLDLTPHAEAVLEKLKSEVGQNEMQEGQRRRREAEIKNRIAKLERYLGSGDAQREETYWRLIKEAREQLDTLQKTPETKTRATPVDLERVAHFLENLDHEWDSYPSRLRNRLLTLLVDRVELSHDSTQIEATIFWKAGFQQKLVIRRQSLKPVSEKQWSSDEESLLKMLWPSSSHEAIIAALPGRTWPAINQRASLFKLKRQRMRTRFETAPQWSKKDEARLKELYVTEADLEKIAKTLGRSVDSVLRRVSQLGIARPAKLRYRKAKPALDAYNMDVMQVSSSPSR